jgi:hypothetical protein
MLARAFAAQTNACFLKLAGPQLVQMFIGDGAKLVRDAFALAKEKAPAIIFIDELDAIGTKRFDSDISGDREVQRTMLELLNQLDGFSSSTQVKVTKQHSCVRLQPNSTKQPKKRSLLQPIELIFWILPCFARDELTERSNFHFQMKKPEPEFCKFTRAR